jgi:hypothetical protein
MTDIIQDLIILDRVPNRFLVSCLGLNMIYLRDQPPHNPKQRKYDNIVQYTIISKLLKEHTRRSKVYE